MPHTPLRLAFKRPIPGTLRGLILWLFGLSFIVIGGINYLGTTVPEPTRDYLSFALDHLPQWVFGWLFVTVGAGSMFSSYCHFDRDKWGYRLAATLTGVWGAVYVCGWLFYGAPVRAVGGAVVWILFSAILTTCARIPKITFDFASGD